MEDEEEDEVSDEEEDEFDIDDSSPEAAALTSPSIGNGLTVQEKVLGQEKSYDMVLENASPNSAATPFLKSDRRRRSKSRSQSRSKSRSQSRSSLRSGVDSPGRFAGPHPHPPALSPRHVEFAREVYSPLNVSDSEQLGVLRGIGRDVPLGTKRAASKEQDADQENDRTPTVSTLVHGRMRKHVRSRSLDHHGRRAFAVWGHDESDSNDDSSA